MEFNRQSGRPAARPAASSQAPAATPATNTNAAAQPPRRESGKKHFAGLALATLLLLSVGFALGKFVPVFGGEYGRVDRDKYQAVFLTNDQVYFGKIKAITDEEIVITDIYYLQKGAEASTGDDAKQDAAAPTQQSNMSLAKLGSELHAPVDQMQINKDQVLFWENLKEDGKVTKAINDYTKKD